jgi:hypothetical protein
MKHTPGPWSIGSMEDGMIGIETKKPLNYIAEVHAGYEPSDESYANCRLIAAAPEMYELLERYLCASKINDLYAINKQTVELLTRITP